MILFQSISAANMFESLSLVFLSACLVGILLASFAGIIAICNKASKGKINNFIQNMFKED